jgi:hypothetical protein
LKGVLIPLISSKMAANKVKAKDYPVPPWSSFHSTVVEQKLLRGGTKLSPRWNGLVLACFLPDTYRGNTRRCALEGKIMAVFIIPINRDCSIVEYFVSLPQN